MSEAKRIREHYLEPPLILRDCHFWKDGKKHRGAYFEVQTKIWVDMRLPEYRVVAPMQPTFDGNSKTIPDAPIEMRYSTYVPTGRTVYDGSRYPEEPIVYEYILESLLGKKELRR